ncbi:uncharacterized protein DS421_13g406430 [Arachis hypogaea]|nr:uncharacterized protein DS421_13g406430 [Arachis hypogaea]
MLPKFCRNAHAHIRYFAHEMEMHSISEAAPAKWRKEEPGSPIRACHQGLEAPPGRRTRNGASHAHRPRNGPFSWRRPRVGDFVPGGHELDGQSGKSRKLTCIGVFGWQGCIGNGARSVIKGGWGEPSCTVKLK